MIKYKKILKKAGMAIVIFLLIAILMLLGLRTSIVQKFIADSILSSLSKSLNAELTVKDIKVNFFDEATIVGLLLKDQKGDTLIYSEKAHLDVSLFSFFKKQFFIDKITLDEPVINISDEGNGLFNFSFLLPEDETEKVNPQTDTSWRIDIDKVIINNLNARYVSNSQQIKIFEKLLDLDFNAFNPEDNIFELAHLSLNGGKIVHLTIPDLNPDTDSSGFVLPDIGVRINSENIHLTDQSLTMINGMDSATVSNIQLETKDFQWNKNHLSASISSAFLESDLGLNLHELDGMVVIDSNQLILDKLNILSNRDNLTLSGNLLLDNSPSGVLSDLKAEISAQTLLLMKPLLPDDIVIQSGLPVSLAANEITFSKNNVQVKNLDFSYGKKLQLKGNYSLKNFTLIDQMEIVADIKSLKIDQPQLRKILPALSIPDSLKQYTAITLSGLVNGPVNNLKFSKIKTNLNNQVTASLSGNLRNILTPENIEYNLIFDEIKTDIKDLPLPKNNTLAMDSLGKVQFSGRIAGSMASLSVDGLFNSYLGSIRMNSKIDFADNIEDLIYKGTFDLKTFDLGTLLIRDDIGVVSLSTDLSGQGFNLSTLNSNIKGRIDDFSYNGYNYQNITMDAIYKDCLLDGNLTIDDKNVKLSYTGKIDLTSDKIQIDFKADIDTINFAALNLLNTRMGMKTAVHADFQMPLSTDKKGRIAFYGLQMNQDGMRYEDDTLLIDLNRIDQNTEIDISSNFFTGHIDGDFKLKEMPLAFSEIIKVYTGKHDTLLATSELKSKNIHFKGNFESLDPVNNFISDHDIFLGSGRIDLEIDLTSFRIRSNSRLDSFIFDGNLVEIAQLRTTEDIHVPNLQIEGYNINTAGNISFPYLYINSTLDNNTVQADISIEDEDNIPKLEIGSKWTQEASGDLVLVLDSNLILNNASWNINGDNRITFGQVLNINNLRIFDDDESMTIKSSDSSGQNLNIDLENFNIRQFITLLTSDPIDMSGAMNGNIELKDLSEDFYFLINVTLNDIVYNSKPVGSILLTANDDPKSGIISGTFDLIGSENDIIGNGTFDPNTRQLNWDIFMGLLEMRLLDPFLDEIISESKGIMFGELRLTGTLEKPNIFGELSFENISTNVDLNNTRYDIPSHKITFSNDKIDIGQLTVNDQEGNTALVTGAINHNFYNDFDLDLNINTDQFVFLNTTTRINPIFYGKIILDADINLTGPPDLVEVNANAKALKNSTLTISPFSQTESILKEEFIRYGKPEDYENQSTRYLQQIARLYPYIVNINLDVDENADFTFVVDPLSGDKLNCKGVGSLRVNLSPSGQQEIYGNYQVSSGEYSFSYGDFVNRRFNIQPGGIIRFNGNPLDAVLDVKAVYSAYTSPYELIKNEVTLSESEINTARRRTNVEVLLSLSGSLLSPEINLDLSVPELQAGNIVAVVDRKINSLRNNPDDLNNQVFALLVLNQFLSTETTSSGFDKVGQNLALSSISNLISSELNRLAKNVIKGVDVNIDVNSYNSQYLRESGSATVTEIGLSVSKQLFNDRISVSAGGNLNIDDYSLAEGSFASFVGDFVLEYRLTESGNYKLRVFSKRDYDRLLNENTSRNGISLFFSKEFDEKTGKK